MGVRADKLQWMYRAMLEIRCFEETAIETWRQRLWRGSLHGCIGQEAPAAAMCAAMEPGDYFSSNHRGHGHYIAKGLDPGKCMAELFGRSTGYCRGRGGSMHTIDVEKRIFGNSMVLGGLDVWCMSQDPICNTDYHIHAWHTDSHFSKLRWHDGGYDTEDMALFQFKGNIV